MNANELADYLETSVGTAIYARKKAATMLRQLQKQLELHKNAHHEAVEIARQQQADIELLEKALEQIATGEITGESINYKDTVCVMRQIASDALTILRKAQKK